MIISINQPAYLPWLGYFDRIKNSDIHIVLDHVQFEKNSMVNRNKVRTQQGESLLTVPVITKGKFGNLPISELTIDNNKPWKKKHWKSIEATYRKAPFAKDHIGFFEEVYAQDWDKLNGLNAHINNYILKALNIKSKIIYSSSLDVHNKKSDLVLEICKIYNAKTYISGALGRDYLDLSTFEDANINVVFQDYNHPIYNQVHGDFIPYMSVIDLLFNAGSEARNII
ncbi:MAG: WbqC family protein [Alphaproteobacteria bacterium]|nr:hypothetical protein [Alphaproteobacteria bacterium]MCS5597587.1 WbqC family protein [Alphaproteobacteria bacterium]